MTISFKFLTWLRRPADPAASYALYRNPKSCDTDDWGRPRGRYPTLAAAMAAAGLPDPASWETGYRCPDAVDAEPGPRTWWSILAPGAAAEAIRAGARPHPLTKPRPAPGTASTITEGDTRHG